jgi:PAS domain S-box-containing protein
LGGFSIVKQKTEKKSLDNRHLKLIADNSQDVLWVLDIKRFSYLYVSPSIKHFRGFEPQEVIGRPISEMLSPDSYANAITHLRRHLDDHQEGKSNWLSMEVELNKKDGGTIWGEVTTQFVKNESGEILIVGVTRDITKRKKLQTERDHLVEELRKSLEEQKRLNKENRVLRGLLPICAECKKIRDENGEWQDLELYIEQRSEAQFTHTLCPECMKLLWPELKTEGK